MQWTKPLPSVLYAMALSLFLAGCSERASKGVDDGKTIELMFIGQITDTANATPVPESLAGVEAAVKRINADGGINGRMITLITCDDKADANEAAKCARQAVRENVSATIGNNSNFGEAILAVLERGGVASIGQLPITQQDFSSPVAFPLQAGSAGMIAGAAKLLASQGATAIALAAVDSPAGALNEQFAKAGLAGTSAKVLGLTLVPIEAPDYASYAATVARGSDGILIGMNSDQAGRFVQSLKQAGASQRIALTVGAVPPSMVSRLGVAAEGLFVTSPFRPVEAGGASNAQYLADMKAYAPKAKQNVFSQGGWVAVETFAKVMKARKINDFSPANVLDVMGSLEDFDAGDMIPPLTTNTTLPAPYNRLFVNKVMFARIQDGQLALIDEEWHGGLIQ